MFADADRSPLPLFGADAAKRVDRTLEVLRLERRGHLHADARRPLRHDREPEARDEDALVEEASRERHRLGRLADDYRDDRRLALQRRVAGLDEQLAEDTRVLAQPREQRRILKHELD